jgi:hypothetical protein
VIIGGIVLSGREIELGGYMLAQKFFDIAIWRRSWGLVWRSKLIAAHPCSSISGTEQCRANEGQLPLCAGQVEHGRHFAARVQCLSRELSLRF